MVRTIEGEMKYVDENCYDVTEFKGELKNWTKKPVFIKMLFETLKKCRSCTNNNPRLFEANIYLPYINTFTCNTFSKTAVS